MLKTAEELKIKGLADVSGKSIPRDDDDDSISYGPSHLTAQSRDDDRRHDSKNDHMTDYDDMFAPTVIDGDPSINVRHRGRAKDFALKKFHQAVTVLLFMSSR